MVKGCKDGRYLVKLDAESEKSHGLRCLRQSAVRVIGALLEFGWPEPDSIFRRACGVETSSAGSTAGAVPGASSYSGLSLRGPSRLTSWSTVAGA